MGEILQFVPKQQPRNEGTAALAVPFDTLIPRVYALDIGDAQNITSLFDTDPMEDSLVWLPRFVPDQPRLYLLPSLLAEDDEYVSLAADWYGSSFEDDFAQLERIRAFSRAALAAAGIEEDGKSGATKLFDIDKERWNWERCVTEEQRAKFKQELYRQIVTAIWEREKGTAAEFTFLVKDGELWSEFWDEDPLSVIYRRGYELKQKDCEKRGGSPDAKREWEEILGLKRINAEFTDPYAPAGKIAIVISPPGKEYPGNYVMGYESLRETVIDKNGEEQQAVRYKQYTSSLSDEDYKRIALSIDPGYLDGFVDEKGQEVMPLDAWFKGRPFIFPAKGSLQTVDDIYKQFFNPVNTAKEQELFAERINDAYDLHILYLIDQITNPDEYKVVTSHIALHNIYVESDKERKREKEQVKDKNKKNVINTQNSQPRDAFSMGNRKLSEEQYRHVAAQAQRNTAVRAESVQAGCGPSNGIRMKRNAMRTMFAGTVGMRGINSLLRQNSRGEVGDEEENICERCPEFANDASDNHYHCLGCNTKYPDETNRAPEDRTPACTNCNKPLGCGIKPEEKQIQHPNSPEDTARKQEHKEEKKEEKEESITDFTQRKKVQMQDFPQDLVAE